MGPVPNPPSSLVAKMGLAVGSGSLGVGAANFVSNRQSAHLESQKLALEQERNKLEAERKRLDQKSLNALKSIHNALVVAPPVHPVSNS